jgi:hypothetical protein
MHDRTLRAIVDSVALQARMPKPGRATAPLHRICSASLLRHDAPAAHESLLCTGNSRVQRPGMLT